MKRASRQPSPAPPPPVAHHLSAADRLAAGKLLRDKLPRQSHGVFKRDADHVDPLAILRASDNGRIAQLLPIRYGRMLQSPFTFYRGSAAVMAADLARTPATGIRVQACGDCHLMNFGGFATPERNLVFDINDFDETLPAPWEWDLKRLVASFALAARSNGLSDAVGRNAAVACARSYRKRLREYSQMTPLQVWYARITTDDVVSLAPSKEIKARFLANIAKSKNKGSSELIYPEVAAMVSGRIRIHDNRPLIFHPGDDVIKAKDFVPIVETSLKKYRETLPEDRRVLLDRYRLVDGAIKVVGIGSVGTMCLIVLLMSEANEPLFLQWKEARQSVLEPYAGKSDFPHHGERVVMGQRLMQPATDLFMGWVTGTGPLHKQGYVRQLRDVKVKPVVETFDAETMLVYAKLCGWILARANAKAGDALTISGYLGSQDNFDEAMGRFAVAYADQAERDHAALKAAVKAGKIEVLIEAA